MVFYGVPKIGNAFLAYILNSMLKFSQVDKPGMFRMTSSARYFK
jgi:hypothetical protein